MWRHFALAFCCFTAAVIASERSPAKVRIHHERSSQAELIASVEALGKTHHLKLKRTSMPSVRFQELIVDANGTVTIQEVGENQTRNYYQDEETGAFLFMNDENTLEGMVSDNVALHYENDEHTASDINEKSSVSFCGVSDDGGLEHFKLQEDSQFQGEDKALSYVAETLVFSDSTLTNFRGQSIYDYMRLYWKMVDRRFRTVVGAVVSVRLSAIVICKTVECDHLLMDTYYQNYADLYVTDEKFSGFIAKYKSRLGPFDLAHLMTRRDLYFYDRTTNKYVMGAVGRAYEIGEPCVVSNDFAHNTAVSEDRGLYSGILTTAHEIGHNLGAYHDPENSLYCSWNLGYLMSYERINARTFIFSSCSSASMVATFKQNFASCLRTNEATSWEPYPDNVPGLGVSFDTQCKWLTSDQNAIASPNRPDNSHCFMLYCQWTSGGRLQDDSFGYPAMDGTPCRTGGYCKAGSCQASWQ